MKKKWIILVIFIVILAIGFAIAAKVGGKPAENQPGADDNKIIFYYREDCSHCVTVKNFIAENQVREKIIFEEKEAFKDLSSQKEMLQKAKFCSLKETEVGFPFLWDGAEKKCFMGDTPLIEFFQKKLNEAAAKQEALP